jgi:nitrogen fixation/metabolism regulation signal transduction histidine kinase
MDEQQQNTGSGNDESLRKLKHDIKNQLSNIYLALEQLRYELPDDVSEDCTFYMDTILTSSTQINNLLNNAD